MFKRELAGEEKEFALPASTCAIWDIFYIVSMNPNRAQLGRIFAALIGLTLKNSTVPKYSLSDCDPIAYGGKVQEWLIKNKISPVETLTVGTEILTYIQDHFVTSKEVEGAENF